MADTALLQEFNDFYHRSGLNQSQIARAVTVSSASISMYLSGKYEQHGGNINTIERKIREFLDRQRSQAHKTEVSIGFVATATARRIHAVMADAHSDCEIAVIYGQAGLGKTHALKEYCKQHPSSILIETNPSYTAQVLMRKIATAIKVPTEGTLNDVFEACVERLRDSGRLLVIDEAENLPLRALEIIRRLHDMTDIGLVLAGMPRLIVNLRGQRGELVQLSSRVGIPLNLGDSIPHKELAQIAKTTLPNASPATIEALVQESKGNTRILEKLIRGVIRTAEVNSMEVNAEIAHKYSKIMFR